MLPSLYEKCSRLKCVTFYLFKTYYKINTFLSYQFRNDSCEFKQMFLSFQSEDNIIRKKFKANRSTVINLETGPLSYRIYI